MAAEYQFDPKEGRFTVQAFASGMLSSLGHNPNFAIREFSGRVQTAGETVENATLELTVKAASLAVSDDNINRKDEAEINKATQEDVLESARYSEIRYTGKVAKADRISDGFFRVRIEGRLSLHGADKDQVVEAQLKQRDDRLRLSGETRLKLSDYNLKRVSALAGALKLKDEVKFTFELVAVRRDG